MKLEKINLAKSLNKAYFKQSLKRESIDLFIKNFNQLFERIDDNESEEHNKNIISDFLKNTYYKDKYEINTAGRKDLVIHKGNSNETPVSVIIEAKKPNNKSEMISFNKPNVKSLHETIHYYLHERIVKDNKEIKHIIITNIYEWYIFDASEFEKLFYQNKKFRRSYKEWNSGKLPGQKTDWFYNEIAKPFVENYIENIQCTYISLKDYEKIVNNTDKNDNKKLINLYKIFSPEHLLKLSFSNDYNKIDAGFYNELLYILGLEENKKGGKKLITRVKEKNRKAGSLLENTINIISVRHKLKNIERLDLFGKNEEEQLFSIALELSITWLNRILFLKLLEGQLIKYHKGNTNFAFLNFKKINDFDELDELFFEVLAVKPENRTISVNNKFGDLPYLNSSLFEITELEERTTQISALKDRLTLPIASFTVLKDEKGKNRQGELNTLEYLFEFLNAYNFSSETKAEIQDDNKTIINAAVLGLIFEKINGYQDGAFYTPSFITTFISRETIRTTVINKFSKAYDKKFKSFENLKDFIDYSDSKERKKANEIINSIKICDPAVGSGHFIVSALNELVAVKSELKIIEDVNGKRIRGIKIENINDELEIIDEETSEPFQYYVNEKGNPPSEIQNIQKAIFYEKRNLIENCIYGVDINPKSVLICRLRLWIELLKNTFYTEESNYKFLETLPNIDINIKTGNSLISKFDTGLDLFELTAVKNNITQYKLITEEYKKTSDYEQKTKFRDQIKRLKSELEKYAIPKDKYYRKYLKKSKELGDLLNAGGNSKAIQKQIVKINAEVTELEKKYKENYHNVYANSMEWSIEFPEILSDNGEFQGFDLVIGNPPYFSISKDRHLKEVKENYQTFKQTGDIYMLFIERATQILKKDGILSYITSNKWMRAAYGENLRKFLLENTTVDKIIDFDGLKVFDEATVDTNIILLFNKKNGNNNIKAVRFDKTFDLEKENISDYFDKNKIKLSGLTSESWTLASEKEKQIKNKLIKKGKLLENWNIEINRGILTGFNEAFFIDEAKKEELIKKDPKSAKIIKPLLRGRDVHKYYIDKKNRFLIDTYNGKLVYEEDKKTGKKKRIRKYRVIAEKYPAIYEHLKKYETQLKKRDDQGEHWTNHRNCAYQELFSEKKIIYPETTGRRSEFYLDKNNYLIDKTCFMITGDNLEYLLAVLSSKVIEFYYEREGRLLGKQAIQYSKQYVEKIPIPEITEKNQKTVNKIEELINEILRIKEKNTQADISKQQTETDKLIYKLYELTKEEIEIIENN